MNSLALSTFTLIVGSFLPLGSAQMATILGNAKRSDACSHWSQWGPCMWVKAPRNSPASHPWKKPYFEQLSPDCRRHQFFSEIRKKYGAAVENAFEYFKSITQDTQPCGQCSYQSTCGSRCSRADVYNVTEQKCSLYDQSNACTMEASQAPQYIAKGCKVWPSDRVELSGVPEVWQRALKKIGLINCAVGRTDDGRSATCRCCCKPYKPDASGRRCIL